ncbi:restriction endonuclease subunit S [uncultured Prevotella sp.]|uniref:restriction endonuclease subunit S n=1 Tax=uncultured Prevotella sp. TaxID=159272 RepID=UPI0027E32BEF|nr:restriction endonuclease subunit S [uncultured Prevotella sp.]
MEFTTYTLGEVCSRLSSGKSIKAAEIFPAGKYPVYGGNGLRGYADRNNFEGECAIIGRQGAYCGNVRYFKGEAYMTEHAVVCQANEKADTYYLSALLSTLHLERLSGQSAQPGLAVGTLSVQEINLPSLETQRSIASILSSLDRKIELNNKINADLEEMAQAIFKNWLSECSDEVTIGDLSLNITNYEKTDAEEVVLINSSDVTEGFFNHHNNSPNKNLKGHFKKRFQKGDILYSQVRPRNRHWAYCDFDANNYLASTQLMVIRNNPSLITSILLYQYIISDNVWKEFTLKTETRSGTFPQGNYEDLSQIRVPYHSGIEGISKQLETIYAKIFLLQKENTHLSLLRDTLLPRLMSGEIEVPD